MFNHRQNCGAQNPGDSDSQAAGPERGAAWLPSPVFITLAALVSLACSWGGAAPSGAVRIKNLLPTFTPTTAAVAQAKPAAALPGALPPAQPAPATPTATARAAPPLHLPTLTPTPIPQPGSEAPAQPVIVASPDAGQPTLAAPPTVAVTPTFPVQPTALPPIEPNPTATLPPPPDSEPEPNSEVPGWSFRAVHTSLEEGNAVVVGELINSTGSPQQAVEVSGIFYDAQDQVIEDEIDTLSYVPVEVIPPGAHVPFELTVESPQPIYRLDLVALSAPATDFPRQDFQFANINQWAGESNMYCLSGQVQNTGSPLADYLVIMATTYDDQGQVAGFGEYAPAYPEVIVGSQTTPFEICIDPLNQQIARHEFRAVGY